MDNSNGKEIISTIENLVSNPINQDDDIRTSPTSWVVEAIKNKISQLSFRFYNVDDWSNVEELNKKVLPDILAKISTEELQYNGQYLNYDISAFAIIASQGLVNNELILRIKYQSMYFFVNFNLESNIKVVTNDEVLSLVSRLLIDIRTENPLIYHSLQVSKPIVMKKVLTSWIRENINNKLEKLTINSIPITKLNEVFKIEEISILSINFYEISETNEISFTLLYQGIEQHIILPIQFIKISSIDIQNALQQELNQIEVLLNTYSLEDGLSLAELQANLTTKLSVIKIQDVDYPIAWDNLIIIDQDEIKKHVKPWTENYSGKIKISLQDALLKDARFTIAIKLAIKIDNSLLVKLLEENIFNKISDNVIVNRNELLQYQEKNKLLAMIENRMSSYIEEIVNNKPLLIVNSKQYEWDSDFTNLLLKKLPFLDKSLKIELQFEQIKNKLYFSFIFKSEIKINPIKILIKNYDYDLINRRLDTIFNNKIFTFEDSNAIPDLDEKAHYLSIIKSYLTKNNEIEIAGEKVAILNPNSISITTIKDKINEWVLTKLVTVNYNEFDIINKSYQVSFQEDEAQKLIKFQNALQQELNKIEVSLNTYSLEDGLSLAELQNSLTKKLPVIKIQDVDYPIAWNNLTIIDQDEIKKHVKPWIENYSGTIKVSLQDALLKDAKFTIAIKLAIKIDNDSVTKLIQESMFNRITANVVINRNELLQYDTKDKFIDIVKEKVVWFFIKNIIQGKQVIVINNIEYEWDSIFINITNDWLNSLVESELTFQFQKIKNELYLYLIFGTEAKSATLKILIKDYNLDLINHRLNTIFNDKFFDFEDTNAISDLDDKSQYLPIIKSYLARDNETEIAGEKVAILNPNSISITTIEDAIIQRVTTKVVTVNYNEFDIIDNSYQVFFKINYDQRVINTINSLQDLEIKNIMVGTTTLDKIMPSPYGLWKILLERNISHFDPNKFRLKDRRIYNSPNIDDIANNTALLTITKTYYFKFTYNGIENGSIFVPIKISIIDPKLDNITNIIKAKFPKITLTPLFDEGNNRFDHTKENYMIKLQNLFNTKMQGKFIKITDVTFNYQKESDWNSYNLIITFKFDPYRKEEVISIPIDTGAEAGDLNEWDHHGTQTILAAFTSPFNIEIEGQTLENMVSEIRRENRIRFMWQRETINFLKSAAISGEYKGNKVTLKNGHLFMWIFNYFNFIQDGIILDALYRERQIYIRFEHKVRTWINFMIIIKDSK